jgi:hypothetical protein
MTLFIDHCMINFNILDSGSAADAGGEMELYRQVHTIL